MKNISETLPRNLLIAVLIVFALGVTGCISQQPEVLKINTVIDYNPLEGFHNKSEGMFTIIKGSIPEVKESLKGIVNKKSAQQSTFSVDDELNFVVFRGVFSTGGYGINIDRVEKRGNIFTVYATYSHPGNGVGVTEAVTQPVAIIPIGELAEGDYEARLKVTRVIAEDVGIKVIETEKESSVFNLKVKMPKEISEEWETDVNYSPPLKTSSLEYLSGQTFDESSSILTKKWDAGNFNGFWLDSETGESTENLAINQSILNNTHRVIEKHNMIYTTRAVPINYQVYRHTGNAPEGTQGFYQAIGWLGEKYVFFKGNRIARIIFEQNASDAKNITTGYLWVFGDGYRLLAHSIEAPLEREAWIEFLNDSNKLDEVILPDRYLYSYPANTNSIPIFITYISSILRGPYEETGEFRYTWLRSQDIEEISKGKVYGIMEVVSVNNGIIELRNKEPIDLAPGSTINLMGNISIQVGNSTISLQFYPESTRRYSTLPSLIDTISAAHPVLKNEPGMREVAGDYFFRDYIQQCCDEGLKFTISAYPKRGGNEESIVITLQNDFTGKERLKNIEIIPEKGEAIAPKIVSNGN